MRTTIDKAGRVIIPAALRAQLGLTPGPVEIVADGAGVRIEPEANGRIGLVDGRWVILGDGPVITDDDVRELRLGDQR